MKEYLKIPELKDGYLYRIRARNGAFGVWVEQVKGFVLSRVKLGANFLFTEFHCDTGVPFGTVFPLLEIEKSPFEGASDRPDFPLYDQVLEYLNSFEVPYEEERLKELGVEDSHRVRLLSYYKKQC